MIFPLKLLKPSISGQAIWFRPPLALIRTSAVSSNMVPSGRFTWMCHLASCSSYPQPVTSCSNLMKRLTENLSAVSSRYRRISGAGAYRDDQFGFGLKEYWYECASRVSVEFEEHNTMNTDKERRRHIRDSGSRTKFLQHPHSYRRRPARSS